MREASDVLFREPPQTIFFPNLHTFSLASTKAPNVPWDLVEIPVAPGHIPSLRTLERDIPF